MTIIDLNRWLELTFLGDRVRDWLAAAGIAAGALLALWLARRLVSRRLARWAGRTATGLDDFAVEMAARTRWLPMLVVALYLGSLTLDLGPEAAATVRALAIIAVLVQVALWGSVGIDFWMARQKRRRLQEDAASATLIGVLSFVGKLVLWTVFLLLALDNIGVDVTALVAGLGVGGIAVALAVQNILGDLLASLSIVIDKPFVLGDTIHVGEFVGTVEHIGLKTTRLRSVSGEQLIFPNGDLLQSRIRNYKRMAERRVVLGFGVIYQTSADVLERIPPLVRRIVESQDGVRFERVHFMRFGESSLDFEAVYFVLSPDYNFFMDRQQAINLALLRELDREGVEFAYPTRTLFLERVGGAGGEGEPAAGLRNL